MANLDAYYDIIILSQRCLCVSGQTSWRSSKSSPAASFDSSEFESVRDKSVKLSSTYNWDQTTTTSKAPSTTFDHKAPSTTLDPNSDDFFNSMLADDKKVTTNYSVDKLPTCR